MVKRFAIATLLLLAACKTATMDNGTIFSATTVVAGPAQTPLHDGAVYVVNGIVRETGAAAGIRRAHPNARVVDATGATILPGLTDAHAHLYGLGLALDEVDLTGTTSYEEVLSRTEQRAAKTPPNEWVMGRGWDQTRWPVKEFPTVRPLDAAVSDRPVYLTRVDGHAGLANSAAMKLAGVSAATPDPHGGRIIRDASGNPTGVFVDAAQDLIERVIPAATHEQVKRRVIAAAQNIASFGLTEIHDAGEGADVIRAVQELIDEHRFPIRLYLMISDNDALENEWFARGPLVGYGGRLTIRSVKMYADGALGSRGAALLEPYSDDPTNSGLVISTVDRMTDVARRARLAGFQVNTHAIGDRGVRNVIDAYEAAGVMPPNRWRIEHFQVVAPPDFARVAHDGIIASMQPTHATSDMRWAENRLGPERIKGAYAWRTVLNSGARLALGSDFPVEDVNPWFGIDSAVTRQDHSGNPPAGWYPEQKLTLAEAIRGFTLDAAYAAFEETSRGTIEPGKLADFTIVDGDPYTTATPLFQMKTRMTVVGGEVVYSPPGAAAPH
ncbi:MAG TPA: amidohydrolase [Thermoanaerobaculia bacterium]|nr:amidohydrolase [Thermoanaerobaculia bacterium]